MRHPRRMVPARSAQRSPVTLAAWFGVVVSAAAVLATSGCGAENTIDPDNRRDVVDRVESQVRGVRVVDLRPSGDGFTQSYGLFVDLDTTSARTSLDARAQARRAAHIIWDHADTQWEGLHIYTRCVAPSLLRSCGHTELSINAQAAHRLWGEPERGAHEPAPDDEELGRQPGTVTGADIDWANERPSPLPPGWSLYGPQAYRGSDHPWWDVFLPAGLPAATREARLHDIAAMLWRDHPDRITGIGLHIMEAPAPTSTGPETPATPNGPARATGPQPSGSETPRQRQTWRRDYTAEQLHARFGPRAPDLPR